jgi:hypothetical protein
MPTLLVVVFSVVYAAIALEHPVKINKSAITLIGVGLFWIGGQITIFPIMQDVLLASVVSMAVPPAIASRFLPVKQVVSPAKALDNGHGGARQHQENTQGIQ